MGGCGAGTKRTPPQSCAIDPKVMSTNYKWDWNHHNDRRLLRRLSEETDDYVDEYGGGLGMVKEERA